MRIAKALSFPVVMAAGLFTLVFCFCCLTFNDPDMWWHMRLGQEVWTTHTIPTSDHWSHTVAGSHWVPHEWLAQLSLFLAYQARGYQGLMLWFSILAGLITVVSYLLSWQYSKSVSVGVLGGFITAFFGTIGYAGRPHMLGYLFLAIELLILQLAFSGRKRLLWILPPLFAIWVNCHASFFLGLGIFGLLVLCHTYKRRNSDGWIPLLLCFPALFMNPIGLDVVLYPLNPFVKQRASLAFVTEWLPVAITDARGLAFFGILFALLVLGLLGRARSPVSELLIFLPIAYLTAQHTRMLFVFGIAAAPVVSRVVSELRTWTPPKKDHLPTNAVLLLLCAGAMWTMFPTEAELHRRSAANNPVAALEFMRKANVAGPILNDYIYGGFLIFSAPEYKVFIDGRGDVFDWNGVLQKYRDWANVQSDPSAILDEYRIQTCVLPVNALEANVLPHLPGWRTAYRDSVSVVFTRTNTGN